MQRKLGNRWAWEASLWIRSLLVCRAWWNWEMEDDIGSQRTLGVRLLGNHVSTASSRENSEEEAGKGQGREGYCVTASYIIHETQSIWLSPLPTQIHTYLLTIQSTHSSQKHDPLEYQNPQPRELVSHTLTALQGR